MLATGETWNDGKTRIHRFSESIVCTDVRFAGKRGQKCEELSAWGLDSQPVDVDLLVGGLVTLAMLELGFGALRDAMLVHGVSESHIEQSQLRGVDVEPGKFEWRGDHVEVTIGLNEVVIADLDDQYNEPAAMTRKRTDAKRAGAWLRAHLSVASKMWFGELLRAIREETGVSMHQWCRMD